MLTWKLWNALNRPPTTHPLYQRTQRAPLTKRRPLPVLVLGTYLLACCTVSLLASIGLQWLPVLAALALAFGNTVYSAVCAVNISGTIARERETNTYDLLCLSPMGALVVSWVLCTGRLFRTPTFRRLHFGIRLLVIVIGLTLGLTLVVPLLIAAHYEAQVANTELFSALLVGVTLTIVFYLDHIQSAVVGSLIGMMSPTFIRHGTESRLRAVGSFLLWQLLSHGLAGAVGFVFLPALYSVLRLNSWLAEATLAVLAVALFYGLREGIIRRLWARLMERLNADEAELDFSTLVP